MSAHKNIDRICIIITVFTLLIGFLFCNCEALGVGSSVHALGYENRLFDNSKVHRIDIVIDDWDGFLETCTSEQYSACSVVIDGESVKNVGIRAKGNTSLSSVKSMNSSRYSFKIEFDQYEDGKTYHGLDKLCLNNIIQDNTYMKDYLAYTLMESFGVDTPLCSYAEIYVNGEEWGLYLAVESIEESFLTRNYGNQYGDLYKPDSTGFGGDFDMKDFGGGMPGDFDPSEMFGDGQMPDFSGGEMPEGFDPGTMFGGDEKSDFKGGGGFGMGSDDVKLKYTDDDIDSYPNIFNNAKTAADTADKKRLIRSLKALLEQSDIESTVDVEEVLRYFVVHNFLVNGDSYTGQMIHNYYLYEEDGQLSMIPWDYNLAYGSFQGGNAKSSVNSPIDSPVSSGDMSDRPMVSWIFDNEEYTEQYHELFSEFINRIDLESFIAKTADMIDEYVKRDATKFCTYEEFQKGVETISKFCSLRSESIIGQLNGTIPSTTEGQRADASSLIDASDINISDMGTMNMGGGKGGFGGRDSREKASQSDNQDGSSVKKVVNMNQGIAGGLVLTNLSNVQKSQQGNSSKGRGGNMPQGGFDPNNMPEGFDPGNMPQGGFDPNNMPEGFDPGNMPQGGFDPNNMPQDNIASDDNSGDGTASDKGNVQISDNNDAKKDVKNDQKTDQKSDRSERPQMGNFPQMGGQSGSNTKTAVILLIASAVILAGGLVFAYKFKR